MNQVSGDGAHLLKRSPISKVEGKLARVAGLALTITLSALWIIIKAAGSV